MRKQFLTTITNILDQDERLFLLLGDIGVFSFREAFKKHPNRVINIGILEQSAISVAAGLAKEGFIPVFHSIAPFIVERGFEQIKVDFGYQELAGIFVSVGASYDYAALGCTHHCPGDISLLKSIPNMKIFTPGSTIEFNSLFCEAYTSRTPSYFRLTERPHSVPTDVKLGKAEKIKEGNLGTVIAVGPLLQAVSDACDKIDVSILYYTTLEPFDSQILSENCPSEKVVVFEPFYEGTLAHNIISSLGNKSINLLSCGVPREFLTGYGTIEDHDAFCGLDANHMRSTLEFFFYGSN